MTVTPLDRFASAAEYTYRIGTSLVVAKILNAQTLPTTYKTVLRASLYFYALYMGYNTVGSFLTANKRKFGQEFDFALCKMIATEVMTLAVFCDVTKIYPTIFGFTCASACTSIVLRYLAILSNMQIKTNPFFPPPSSREKLYQTQ